MKQEKKQIVWAPQPALDAASPLPPNRVVSVELKDDEEVEWIWTSLPEGTEYVSGYNIVKRATE